MVPGCKSNGFCETFGNSAILAGMLCRPPWRTETRLDSHKPWHLQQRPSTSALPSARAKANAKAKAEAEAEAKAETNAKANAKRRGHGQGYGQWRG